MLSAPLLHDSRSRQFSPSPGLDSASGKQVHKGIHTCSKSIFMKGQRQSRPHSLGTANRHEVDQPLWASVSLSSCRYFCGLFSCADGQVALWRATGAIQGLLIQGGESELSPEPRARLLQGVAGQALSPSLHGALV